MTYRGDCASRIRRASQPPNLALRAPHRYIARNLARLRSESFAVTTFLLVVHTLIALALVAVILLQRSEGGGLGIGGGTGGGLMSARGAANLLTRSTTVLATLFIASSILIAVLAAGTNKVKPIDTSLAPIPSAAAPTPTVAPAPVVPADTGVPLAR